MWALPQTGNRYIEGATPVQISEEWVPSLLRHHSKFGVTIYEHEVSGNQSQNTPLGISIWLLKRFWTCLSRVDRTSEKVPPQSLLVTDPGR